MGKSSRRDRGPKDAADQRASLIGLGLAVERLRREAGMTRDAVAKAGGLSGTTVSHVEKGLKKEPRWQTMRDLAKGLNVEVKDLVRLSIELAPGVAGDRLRQREREAREIDIDALIDGEQEIEGEQ